jgi:hypothetical protein
LIDEGEEEDAVVSIQPAPSKPADASEPAKPVEDAKPADQSEQSKLSQESNPSKPLKTSSKSKSLASMGMLATLFIGFGSNFCSLRVCSQNLTHNTEVQLTERVVFVAGLRSDSVYCISSFVQCTFLMVFRRVK